MIVESIGHLLHQCSKFKAVSQGLALHALALKTGVQSDIIVSNHVVNMYAKCGNVASARRLFDEMSDRNLVSWSAMISGYDQFGEPLLAIHLFSQLPLLPNEFVFSSVISACASLAALHEGQQIHAKSLKLGCASIPFVSNALVSMYVKCSRYSDALLVHAGVSEANVVSYNALISGFAQSQQSDAGIEMFKQMQWQGLVPDKFTFAGVLGICTNSDDLHMGLLLHCQTIKFMLDDSAFIGHLIIMMYSKFHLIEEAENAFRRIEEKNPISWNTYISACSHCNDHERALSVFKEMSSEHAIELDDFSFASALTAAAGLASICYGKQIHAYLIRTRLFQDVGVGNVLVNMYAKCGSIENAYYVFSQMLHRNLVSWNTIIAGFGNHGLGGKAVELFEKMKETGVKPDSVTFVGLLAACNHAGLVDEGQVYFNSMEQTYGIPPDIEHFSCLIDLLGRAGRLHKAEEYMKESPFGYNPVVLGSLLSACRLHGDVDIGERLARKLLKMRPVTTSPYVLLSNLYASDEMWRCVAEARKLLQGSGLKKEPAYSLIEVKGTFEKFTMGDLSHSRIKEIRDILKIVSWGGYEVSLSHST